MTFQIVLDEPGSAGHWPSCVFAPDLHVGFSVAALRHSQSTCVPKSFPVASNLAILQGNVIHQVMYSFHDKSPGKPCAAFVLCLAQQYEISMGQVAASQSRFAKFPEAKEFATICYPQQDCLSHELMLNIGHFAQNYSSQISGWESGCDLCVKFHTATSILSCIFCKLL